MRLEHADHTPAHRGYVQGRGPLTTHTLALELVDGRRATVDFKHERNRHSDVYYRWLNEIPALPALVLIVLLVVLKPF